MSKKKVNKNKRYDKTQRRKTLKMNRTHKNTSLETSILKKAKYKALNNKPVNLEINSIEDVCKQCEDKVKDLLIYHYYLIFIRDMIDNDVIQYKLNYDIVKYSKLIRNININVSRVILLDDDIAYIELAAIAENIQNLASIILEEITKTDKIEKQVTSTIMLLGSRLEPKKNGLPYSDQEKFNKVLSIKAIDYMGKHVFNLNEEPKTEGQQ